MRSPPPSAPLDIEDRTHALARRQAGAGTRWELAEAIRGLRAIHTRLQGITGMRGDLGRGIELIVAVLGALLFILDRAGQREAERRRVALLAFVRGNEAGAMLQAPSGARKGGAP